MATANPSPPDRGEDNFVLELRRVREQIKQKFIELIDCVKARECKLLEELDTILASYQSYRDEFGKQKEKKQDLEKTKDILEGKMKISTVKGSYKKVIKQTVEELNSIKFPLQPKVVEFSCDSNIMLVEINKLGKLIENRTNIDYKSKVHPVVSICDEGNGMKQLWNPWGVTVDSKTGNIYVVDQFTGAFNKY